MGVPVSLISMQHFRGGMLTTLLGVRIMWVDMISYGCWLLIKCIW